MSDDRWESLLEQDWSQAWETLAEAPELVARAKTAQITLRLPAGLIERVKRVAATRSLPYHVLVRSWLVDALRESLVPPGELALQPQTEQLNIKLDQAVLDRLKARAHELGRPYHRLAREWVNAALAREEDALGLAVPTAGRPAIKDLMVPAWRRRVSPDLPSGPPEWEIAQARLALTSRQQRIASDLGSRSLLLRDWFLYGLVLIQRRTPEGWEHLLGHTGRELMNRLPDYFPEVPESAGRVSYDDCMDALAQDFPDGIPEGATLSRRTRRQLTRLLARHRASRQSRADREAAFLARSARGDGVPTEDELRWLRDEWKGVHGVMVSAAHLRDPDEERPDADALVTAYGRLQDLLTSRLLEVPFHELEREAQELAKLSDPRPEDLVRARDLLREQLQPGFFAEATPAWLPLLEGAGMLTHPPPPITDGDWVRFPVWPAAKYLVRIAADLPDDVLRIIDAAQDTENERVATEFARALANMPDEYAAGNVERIASWLEDRATHRLLLPQVAEEYLRRLIARDRPEALAFANALLITRAETRDYGGVESEPSRRWVHVELKPARMDRHHYASLLRHAVPQLAARWPLPTAVLLIEQLQTANAQQAAAIGDNASAGASWSSWRRAIEPHPEEFVIDGLRGLLVSAIRDLGQALISEPTAGRELLALLAARHASIFTRLRLHLLRVYGPEHFADLRREAVLDQALLESAEEWHEYALLLEDAFAQLGEADRELYLSWVEACGRTDYLEEQYVERQGGEVPVELRARWLDRQRLQWLSPIKHALPKAWAKRYEELTKEFGELAQRGYTQGFRLGPESPLTATDLNETAVPDAVRFFSGGGAPGTVDDEVLERILDSFERAVKEQPERWAAAAHQFAGGVAAAYVHQLLSGLSQATNEGKRISWERVIALGSHVLAASKPADAIAPLEGGGQGGMTLGHVRSVLARLLADAPRDESFPTECEDKLWNLLTALLQDPSPTLDAHGDALTVAINSTRGQAMRGIIGFTVLKVRRVRQTDPTATLDALPDVKAILEERLDPLKEPSRAVRAIYATGLAALAWVDKTWLATQVPRIFPADDDAMCGSAWDSYIRWSSYRADVVELLGAQYMDAVKSLTATDAALGSGSAAPPAERLGTERQNLARDIYIAAWCQSPALAAAVEEFQTNAPATDRAAGVSFLGYALHNDDAGKPFRDDLDGLRRLWASRLGRLPDADPELAAFGTWFASGCFTDPHDLELLTQTVRRAGTEVDDIYEVLGALAECGSARPQATFDALSAIVKEPPQELGLLGDRIEAILTAVLAAAHGELRTEVAKLIDHLEWRGFRGLNRLLTQDVAPVDGS